MTSFRLVPDSLQNREPFVRGRIPVSPLSKALLNGSTVFVAESKKKTWGSLYRLAQSHSKRARIKSTILNGEKGYIIWFEVVDR